MWTGTKLAQVRTAHDDPRPPQGLGCVKCRATPTNDEYKVRVMVAVLEPVSWGNLIYAQAACRRTCSHIE
jgi:hypothetical protein